MEGSALIVVAASPAPSRRNRAARRRVVGFKPAKSGVKPEFLGEKRLHLVETGETRVRRAKDSSVREVGQEKSSIWRDPVQEPQE